MFNFLPSLRDLTYFTLVGQKQNYIYLSITENVHFFKYLNQKLEVWN